MKTNPKPIDRIWLHLFNGNKLSDRKAMTDFAYGAFRSRVAENRLRYHIQDEFVEIEPQGHPVRYKEYWICPIFLKTPQAKEIKQGLIQRIQGGVA